MTTTIQDQTRPAETAGAEIPGRPPVPVRALLAIWTRGAAASPAVRRLSWLAARTLV